MKTLRRVGAFVRRHKRAEEDATAAIGLQVLWTVAKRAGLIGAGVASAAVVSTLTSSVPAYHPAFSLSVKGAAFLTRQEGVRLTPYNDAGNACTTGVGHLIHFGPCTAADVKRWTLTSTQATTLLMHDAATAENYVRSSVTHPISQPQFDALVSFTFNVGGGGLQRSSALRYINAGSFSAVPAALGRWSTAAGRFLPGLYARRMAEGHLFLTGDYGPGLGVYVPPRPAVETTLRAKTGYWSWLAWRLGQQAWKPYGKSNPRVRPHVPARVPGGWWERLTRHERRAK